MSDSPEKSLFVKIFWPVLRLFESDEPAVGYKRSHRVILLVVGSLFFLLGAGSAMIAISVGELGGAIPSIVFTLVGLVALIVGTLGSDTAVTKIWGSRR